jgi:4-amino-4-deoxy-L-arabinose transferase-like glycosyltransferase
VLRRLTLAAWLVPAAAIVPRLIVLLHERGSILSSFTEKSDDFAVTFVHSGTYGFIPGVPSANTQPLYGWFLIPIYWIFGRNWEAVGLAQIAVAACTAWLVYLIGRRELGVAAGIFAALATTLEPYLVWHDVHVNREIVDQPLAAAIVLLALVAVDRLPSDRLSLGRRSAAIVAALGVVTGLAVLGNTRLVLVPVLVALYLLWRRGRRAWPAAAVVVVAAVAAVLPWAIRNDVQVGCFTLTTDSRALWKANNPNTYSTLARGNAWIDDVPPLPHAPQTPEQAYSVWRTYGRVERVDECAQMRLYQNLVYRFWVDHPGEKAKLAGQATRMYWDPRPLRTASASSQETSGFARAVVVPVYVSILYALGLLGLARAPRRLSVLLVALLAYNWVLAMAFAGQTRYRIPWDFCIALLAASLLARRRPRSG